METEPATPLRPAILVAARAPVWGWPASSSTTIWTGRPPRIPPFWLISAAAISQDCLAIWPS